MTSSATRPNPRMDIRMMKSQELEGKSSASGVHLNCDFPFVIWHQETGQPARNGASGFRAFRAGILPRGKWGARESGRSPVPRCRGVGTRPEDTGSGRGTANGPGEFRRTRWDYGRSEQGGAGAQFGSFIRTAGRGTRIAAAQPTRPASATTGQRHQCHRHHRQSRQTPHDRISKQRMFRAGLGDHPASCSTRRGSESAAGEALRDVAG